MTPEARTAAERSRLEPTAAAEAQRILDRAARRLLAERLEQDSPPLRRAA